MRDEVSKVEMAARCMSYPVERTHGGIPRVRLGKMPVPTRGCTRPELGLRKMLRR